MKVALGALLVFMLVVSGCGVESSLRKRAAFDLNCPEGQLAVHDLGGWVRGVRGCGNKATYVYNQDSASWIMNSEVDPQEVHPTTNHY